MRKMFSKNQIEEMIQSGVSSGATKLYLHYIAVSGIEFEVISKIKESFEGLIFNEVWSQSISMKYATGDYEACLSYNGDDIVYIISTSGSISSIDINNDPEIETDEVTPL